MPSCCRLRSGDHQLRLRCNNPVREGRDQKFDIRLQLRGRQVMEARSCGGLLR
jgi:hypothetical protein